MGRDRRHEDDLNAGSFAVVQLYHRNDIGSLDDPHTFREFWDTTVDEYGDRIRIDRGPIFAADGSTERDWDPYTRVPVFVMTLDKAYHYADGSPITTQDVFQGKFIEAIRHGLKPIVKRVRDSGRARAREVENQADAIGREMGDYLWYEANKTGQTRDTSITRDESLKAMRLKEKRDRWRTGFEDLYVPPAPKGHT